MGNGSVRGHEPDHVDSRRPERTSEMRPRQRSRVYGGQVLQSNIVWPLITVIKPERMAIPE